MPNKIPQASNILECEIGGIVMNIENVGHGIYHLYLVDSPIADRTPEKDSALAQAIAWWRKETKKQIISVAAFGQSDESWPSLIIVTENDDTSD